MTMETLGYPLADGYIHHWLVAGPQAVPVEIEQSPAGAEEKRRIARRFHQADIGVEGDPVEYGEYHIGEIKDRWRYVRTRHDHLVDLSADYPSVRYLRAWAYAELWSTTDRDVTVRLTTHGPADLWINGRHIHRREHFQEPLPATAAFPARISEGVNRLVVRFESVAVRAGPLAMALRLTGLPEKKGPDEKAVRIPTCAPAARYRLKLEELFEACHTRQDVFTRNEKIMVYLPEGKRTAEVPFVIRLQSPEARIYAEAKRDGTRSEAQQPMGYPYQSPEGDYRLRFLPIPEEFYEKNVRITRYRDLSTVTNEFSLRPYGTYPERKRECLQDAARRRSGLFSEIAKMEGGWWKDLDPSAVRQAAEEVNAHAADSVLSLCGLLGAEFRYSKAERFPADLLPPLETCILGYRYWDDEPGGDAMDFRGESRAILFHACEILAGQLHPDGVFVHSGMTGRRHREKGERLAAEWLEKRLRRGFAEWDSSLGFAEIVLALSTLTSLAEDDRMVELAALVLDKLFFTIAVNSFRGVFGSTQGRAQTSQILTGYREAASGITRLLWGMGIFNARNAAPVSLACSTYELPPLIAAIAADSPAEIWSRERHAAGEPGGAVVDKVTYKTPDGMLCSAQDWRAGEMGSREHIWQATLSPAVTVFASHPACASEEDARRPNFWLGNVRLPRVAQWKDLLVAIYRPEDDDWMGYTHAYFPVHGMDGYEIREGWAFGRVGDGYIALTAARGLEFMKTGDSAFRELRSTGTPNVWVCQMGRAALDGDFESFKSRVLEMPLKVDGDRVEVTGLRGGQCRFGWESPFLLDGKEQPLGNFKHYENPYCTCEMDAPQMEIRFGADILRLHFED
ncbi:MAG: hypothetical protein JW929_10790 [Anaerolineales bacterium]|nr:hypothetical protein [Anaerolineales bacterium]